MFTVKGVAVISENEMRRGENNMKLGRMRILDLNALRADRLHCGRCRYMTVLPQKPETLR
jgi:hypothetical protein